MMLKALKWVFPLAVAFSSLTVMAANEIRPVKTYSVVSSKYGQSSQSVEFEAKVLNLAYDKQVFVHLKRWDGVWVDVPLQYDRPAENGYEIWTSASSTVPMPPTNTTYDVEYALKYVVNGQTYWESNNGQNFKVASNTGNVLYDRTIYAGKWPSLYAYEGKTSLLVTLANLAYNKQVDIVYSTDGWATPAKEASCRHEPYPWVGRYSGAPSPNAYGFEEWSCGMNVGNASTVEYAFRYKVRGETHWDNNFGHNYRSAIQHP